MRSRGLFIGLTVILVLFASGCSGENLVVVAQPAVREISGLVGASTRTIGASASEVSQLSKMANVTEEVVVDVAPQLERESLWKRSMDSTRSAYREVPDSVKKPAISIACQWVTGEIRTREDFEKSLLEEFDFAKMTDNEVQQAVQDIETLHDDLADALASSDPDERATAVLICFTMDHV